MTVRLRIATDEADAEVVCGLLRSEGIQCFHRETDYSAHGALPGPGGWREILVNAEDLLRARELIDAPFEPVDECTRCGREIGADGGWYPDETRDLHPYCGVCTERLFGPDGLG